MKCIVSDMGWYISDDIAIVFHLVSSKIAQCPAATQHIHCLLVNLVFDVTKDGVAR